MLAQSAYRSRMAVAWNSLQPDEHDAGWYVGRSQLRLFRSSILVYATGTIAIMSVGLFPMRETDLLFPIAVDAGHIGIVLLYRAHRRAEAKCKAININKSQRTSWLGRLSNDCRL